MLVNLLHYYGSTTFLIESFKVWRLGVARSLTFLWIKWIDVLRNGSGDWWRRWRFWVFSVLHKKSLTRPLMALCRHWRVMNPVLWVWFLWLFFRERKSLLPCAWFLSAGVGFIWLFRADTSDWRSWVTVDTHPSQSQTSLTVIFEFLWITETIWQVLIRSVLQASST